MLGAVNSMVAEPTPGVATRFKGASGADSVVKLISLDASLLGLAPALTLYTARKRTD